MAKLRKMLGKPDSPCAVALMRLIENPEPADPHPLGSRIYSPALSSDLCKTAGGRYRPSDALNSCRAYLSGELRLQK